MRAQKSHTGIGRRPGATILLLALGLLGACGTSPEPEQILGPRYDHDGQLLHSRADLGTRRPNLVVILIDTLRADAVALPGGSGAGLMPYVSKLAENGVSFSNVCAPAPWTVPSVTSFLTGLLPSAHGCDAPLRAPRLVGAVTTFAEALRSSYGYETAAYMAGPWFAGEQSVLQGFDLRRHPFALKGTREVVGGFATKRDPKKPFFLLLHSFEAHDPYGAANHPFPVRPAVATKARRAELEALRQPWEIAERVLLGYDDRKMLYDIHGPALTRRVVKYTQHEFAEAPRKELADTLRSAYQAGVRALDAHVQTTIDQLRAWGLLENTLLVITSDHGEAFGEHGVLTHGGQLYDEQIHVPLIMSGPAPFQGGRTIQGSVGLVDVLPTFLELAGCEPLGTIQGRSFLDLVTSKGATGRPVLAEAARDRESTGTDTRQVLTSVRSGHWKYVITFDELAGTVIEEAYDLKADPGERQDLCQGRGRIDGLEFDPGFCPAVEAARDRIWGAAKTSNEVYASPYGGGRARVSSKRPAPCGGR